MFLLILAVKQKKAVYVCQFLGKPHLWEFWSLFEKVKKALKLAAATSGPGFLGHMGVCPTGFLILGPIEPRRHQGSKIVLWLE